MRKLMWFALQIAIVAVVTIGGSQHSAWLDHRKVSPGDVSGMFFIGICLAAFATGLLTRISDLLVRTFRRFIGKQRAGENVGAVPATSGQLFNSSDALRPGHKNFR